MLSQRIVKLHLFTRVQVLPAHHATLLEASVQWVDDNVAYLRGNLSLPSFGDLLDHVAHAALALRQTLAQAAAPGVDAAAETLLMSAERLTASLEVSGQTPPLQLLNRAGRQRMLSQRYAKCTLLALADGAIDISGTGADLAAAQTEFEATLTHLNALPLSSDAIQNTLRDAGVAWLKMVAAARALQQGETHQRDARLTDLAHGSEDLLQLFDQLANLYAHSLDMLLG